MPSGRAAPLMDRIFPKRLGNDYRGYPVALWIFVVITLMRVALGLGHIFNPDGGAQSISHIPLDSYPAGAAQNVVALFARMGLEQLVLGVLFVTVVARYRVLIPLAYVVAAIGQLGVFALGSFKPLSLTGTSGALPLHLVLAVLSVAGLLLSLLGPGYATQKPGDDTN